MKKLMKKRLSNEKGLTLVELLAVIVILGIIAAIAVPSIGNIIQNSREKAVIADAQNTLAAANLYFTENGSKDGDTVSLDKTGDTEGLVGTYLDDKGQLDSATVTKASSGNTITFEGTAGTKKISLKDKTKTDLNDKDILKSTTP